MLISTKLRGRDGQWLWCLHSSVLNWEWVRSGKHRLFWVPLSLVSGHSGPVFLSSSLRPQCYRFQRTEEIIAQAQPRDSKPHSHRGWELPHLSQTTRGWSKRLSPPCRCESPRIHTCGRFLTEWSLAYQSGNFSVAWGAVSLFMRPFIFYLAPVNRQWDPQKTTSFVPVALRWQRHIKQESDPNSCFSFLFFLFAIDIWKILIRCDIELALSFLRWV